jgi:hypothetical protein
MPTLPLRCTIEGRDCDEFVCDHRTGGHRHNVEQATNVSGALQAHRSPLVARQAALARSMEETAPEPVSIGTDVEPLDGLFHARRDDKTPAALRGGVSTIADCSRDRNLFIE